jgi:hypothetical protein
MMIAVKKASSLRAQRHNLRHRISAKISNVDRHTSRGSARDDPFYKQRNHFHPTLCPLLLPLPRAIKHSGAPCSSLPPRPWSLFFLHSDTSTLKHLDTSCYVSDCRYVARFTWSLVILSFFRMFSRWRLTVAALTPRRCAMSLVRIPLRIMLQTLISVGESEW